MRHDEAASTIYSSTVADRFLLDYSVHELLAMGLGRTKALHLLSFLQSQQEFSFKTEQPAGAVDAVPRLLRAIIHIRI